MDRTRKATREGNEITLQHRSPQEALSEAQLLERNLAQLEATLIELQHSPEGTAELQRRINAFGVCERHADETTAQYYDKLRRWLAPELPLTRSPLHPPRQVE